MTNLSLLGTETNATFMFLPTWNGAVITKPYPNFLAACPHLCCKLGTIPANQIAYTTPQSWTCQDFPSSLAFWILHITALCTCEAVAARLHLNSKIM